MYTNSTDDGLNHYFNQNEIEVITESVKQFFLPKDIAKILEIDFRDFKNELTNEDSQAYRAFYKGLMEKEQQIRNDYYTGTMNAEDFQKNAEFLSDYKTSIIIQLD